MGFAEKLGVWVPHELSKNNKENRLQIASQHLAHHRATRDHKQHFLYQTVMGDEKWCLYINIKQRKEWVAPEDMPKPRVKPDLHPRKTMICIWWDWEGKSHNQQGALHSPATSCQRGYSTEKTPSTRPNHTSSQHQASCCTSHQSRTPRA